MSQEIASKSIEYDDFTIASLLEPIKIAMLLGADVPAIPGTKVYTVSVELSTGSYSSPSREHLGVFNTRNGAEKELVAWILSRWFITDHAPWGAFTAFHSDEEYEEASAKYEGEHTVHELIDAYFSEEVEDRFHIDEDIILD